MGTGVLESHSQLPFRTSCGLRSFQASSLCPGWEAGALGWGVLTGGGRVRAPRWGPRPARPSPGSKAAPRPLAAPSAAFSLWRVRGSHLLRPLQTPSTLALLPDAQPRGPVSTSAPPRCQPCPRPVQTSSVELTRGLKASTHFSAWDTSDRAGKLTQGVS